MHTLALLLLKSIGAGINSGMMEVRTQLHVEEENWIEVLSFLSLYIVRFLCIWKMNVIKVKLKSIHCKFVNPTDIIAGPL